MELSRNLESLKELGTTKYLDESLFTEEPEKVEVHYGKNHLQIGRTLNGKIYTIDLKEACRMLILGFTRSGKSWGLRGFTDRVVQSGSCAIYLNDCKNEFVSSLKPLQPKFHNLLFEGEEPKPTKVAVLRGTFFQSVDTKLPKNNFWYSVDIRQLTKTDFKTLLNVYDMSQTQQIAMEIIFEEIVKIFANDLDLEFSLDIINNIIDQIDELNDSSKQSLKFKFRPLESSHFFDHKYQRSIAELLNKGITPSLNMEGYDAFGKGVFRYPDVMMSIVLREVIMARRKKRIKPVWIMFDEAMRFIGKKQQGSIKDLALESTSLDSRYFVNYAYISQTLEDVPDEILKQSKYILVPHSADVATIKEVLVNTGQVRNVQVANNDAMKLKRKMQRHPYSWIIINRMEGSLEIIKFASPLSNHMESGD